MAKIERSKQLIFAGDALISDVYQYGNGAVQTKDVDLIQDASWKDGWGNGGINNGGVITPQFQEFNAISYVLTSNIGHIFQQGIAEYSVDTEYQTNSLVKDVDNGRLYRSLIDVNTNNPLPSNANNANWQYLGALNSLTDAYTVYEEDSSNGQVYSLVRTFKDGSKIGGIPDAYYPNMLVQFLCETNNTGNVSLDIEGLGVVSVLDKFGQELPANSIKNGDYVTAIYSSGNFVWSPTPYVPSIGNAPANQILVTNGLGDFNLEDRVKKFTSADQAIVNGGSLTLSHGLTGEPDFIQVYLRAKTANNGYSIGELTPVNSATNESGSGIGSVSTGQSITFDATNIEVRFANPTAGTVYIIVNKATGGNVSANPSDWDFVIKAFKF